MVNIMVADCGKDCRRPDVSMPAGSGSLLYIIFYPGFQTAECKIMKTLLKSQNKAEVL